MLRHTIGCLVNISRHDFDVKKQARKPYSRNLRTEFARHGLDRTTNSALKKMWGNGFSASDIAKTLGGGLTRNAVIREKRIVSNCRRGLRRFVWGMRCLASWRAALCRHYARQQKARDVAFHAAGHDNSESNAVVASRNAAFHRRQSASKALRSPRRANVSAAGRSAIPVRRISALRLLLLRRLAVLRRARACSVPDGQPEIA